VQIGKHERIEGEGEKVNNSKKKVLDKRKRPLGGCKDSYEPGGGSRGFGRDFKTSLQN